MLPRLRVDPAGALARDAAVVWTAHDQQLAMVQIGLECAESDDSVRLSVEAARERLAALAQSMPAPSVGLVSEGKPSPNFC